MKSGTLDLGGGGVSTSASFTAESGTTLEFAGGHSIDAASTVKGAGTVAFGPSANPTNITGTYDVTGATTTSFSGVVSITGTVQSVGATVTVDGGTLNFTSPFTGSAGTIGAMTLKGGTANFGGNALSLTTLSMTGGTLENTADIDVSGLMTLSGGVISGSGDVNGNGGMLVNANQNVIDFDGRTVNNPIGQTVTWTGSNSNIQEFDGAVFNNFGTILAQNDGQLAQGSGAASTFNNEGSFTKSVDAGTLLVDGLTFDASGGTVSVQTRHARLRGRRRGDGHVVVDRVGSDGGLQEPESLYTR